MIFVPDKYTSLKFILCESGVAQSIPSSPVVKIELLVKLAKFAPECKCIPYLFNYSENFPKKQSRPSAA